MNKPIHRRNPHEDATSIIHVPTKRCYLEHVGDRHIDLFLGDCQDIKPSRWELQQNQIHRRSLQSHNHKPHDHPPIGQGIIGTSEHVGNQHIATAFLQSCLNSTSWDQILYESPESRASAPDTN
jgi:hypothetical protein